MRREEEKRGGAAAAINPRQEEGGGEKKGWRCNFGAKSAVAGRRFQFVAQGEARRSDEGTTYWGGAEEDRRLNLLRTGWRKNTRRRVKRGKLSTAGMSCQREEERNKALNLFRKGFLGSVGNVAPTLST